MLNLFFPLAAPVQAAKRRAIAELIFFAGTNDQRRCKQLAATWNIDVSGLEGGGAAAVARGLLSVC
jgi:hypothetical protein